MDGINFLTLLIQENEKRGFLITELNVPICNFIKYYILLLKIIFCCQRSL